ncbi:unnamed protein product [Prunus armeniaca]
MGNKTECTGFFARATIKPETKAGLDKTEKRLFGNLVGPTKKGMGVFGLSEVLLDRWSPLALVPISSRSFWKARYSCVIADSAVAVVLALH